MTARVPLIVLIVVIGFYPKVIFNATTDSVVSLVDMIFNSRNGGLVGVWRLTCAFEIDYLALAPELVVVATMLGVFALDLVLPRA